MIANRDMLDPLHVSRKVAVHHRAAERETKEDTLTFHEHVNCVTPEGSEKPFKLQEETYN